LIKACQRWLVSAASFWLAWAAARSALAKLLIEVGRIDLRQKLPALHVRADILVPLFQIARHAGKNRRFEMSLNIAGQRQFLVGDTALRSNHRDGRNRLYRCLIA
jgi:hypothetical protein